MAYITQALFTLFFTLLLLLNWVCQAQSYSGPITITKGGTYSGNWESLNSSTAAVTVSTTEPVIIENSRIRSRGHLIRVTGSNRKVTVRNTYGFGLPPNVNGKSAGRFLTAESFDYVTVEHCYMEGTAGMKFLTNKGTTAANSIKIRYNKAINIDGRFWTDTGYTNATHNYAQFVQFDKVRNQPGVEIAWNEIINQPHHSRPEDNINFYWSTGTAASPFLVHDNYIQGAYTAIPGSGTDDFYGGGIIVDSDGASNIDEVSGFIKIYNNTVVSTANYGCSISAGHDNEISNNRVVSSGFIYDGTHIAMDYGTGITNWDAHHIAGTFYNNHVKGNFSSLIRERSKRSDYWLPAADEYSLNSNLGTPTQDLEINEFVLWRKKLITNQISIGPASFELNHVSNFGFEQGNDLWEKSGTTTAKKINARSVSWAMEFGPSAGSRKQTIPLEPSKDYILEGYGTVSASGESGYLAVDFYTSSKTKINGNKLTFTGTTYEKKSISFTSPANTAYIILTVGKDAGTGALFHADDISIVKTTATGNYEAHEPNKFFVYVPSKGELEIDAQEREIQKVDLLNELGQNMYQASGYNQKKLSVSLPKIAPGFYILILHTSEGILKKKITLE